MSCSGYSTSWVSAGTFTENRNNLQKYPCQLELFNFVFSPNTASSVSLHYMFVFPWSVEEFCKTKIDKFLDQPKCTAED